VPASSKRRSWWRWCRGEKGRVTCSLGYGANDVGMIRAAHVGVGIIGLEDAAAGLGMPIDDLQRMIVDAIGDADANLNDAVVVEDVTDEFESVAVVEAPTPPVIGADEGTSPAEDVPESSEFPGAGDMRLGGVNDGLEFTEKELLCTWTCRKMCTRCAVFLSRSFLLSHSLLRAGATVQAAVEYWSRAPSYQA
jgi:magnesium-transporting ATPase (P-type)